MSPLSTRPQDPVDLALEYERLSVSFQAMGGGVWDYDISADVLYGNDRWYGIMGRDPVRDRIVSIEQFKPWIYPDDVAIATEVDPVNAAAVLERGDGLHTEFRIVRPDGEVRWVRSVASLVVGQTNANLRVIGCVTDITELRIGAPVEQGAVTTPMRALAPTAADRAAEEAAAKRRLTNKERDCLMWVCVGKSAWETAAILGVSPRTVEFHLNNATRKLDACNKVHAAFVAVKLGLLDPR